MSDEIERGLDELAELFVERSRVLREPRGTHEWGTPLTYSPLSAYGPIEEWQAPYAAELLKMYLREDRKRVDAAWDRLPEDLKNRVLWKIAMLELDEIVADLHVALDELDWKLAQLKGRD